MGCDIHAAIEGRPTDSDEPEWWPLATDVYIIRNYCIGQEVVAHKPARLLPCALRVAAPGMH